MGSTVDVFADGIGDVANADDAELRNDAATFKHAVKRKRSAEVKIWVDPSGAAGPDFADDIIDSLVAEASTSAVVAHGMGG